MNLKNIALKAVGQYLNLHAHIRPIQAAAIGLNLFCRPFAKKLKPHQKQYLKEDHQLNRRSTFEIVEQ